MMSKALSKNLTSYDLIKTVAVLLMVIDHVTAYFAPDLLWLRVAGRLCVPIWFFLIGYARSRDLGPKIWIAVGLLIASDFVAGLNVFPLSILVTIILIRLLLNPFMKLFEWNKFAFCLGCLVLVLLIWPVDMVMEYGAQGFVLAIFGYLVRHVQERKEGAGVLYPYMVFSIVIFTITQWANFQFPGLQALALFAGNIGVLALLYHFRPMTYPKLTAFLPRPFTAFLRLTGRRTLEIYVLHLLIIKALALLVRPEWYSALQWVWFPIN